MHCIAGAENVRDVRIADSANEALGKGRAASELAREYCDKDVGPGDVFPDLNEKMHNLGSKLWLKQAGNKIGIRTVMLMANLTTCSKCPESRKAEVLQTASQTVHFSRLVTDESITLNPLACLMQTIMLAQSDEVSSCFVLVRTKPSFRSYIPYCYSPQSR